MYEGLFIRSPTAGHLGCLWVSAISFLSHHKQHLSTFMIHGKTSILHPVCIYLKWYQKKTQKNQTKNKKTQSLSLFFLFYHTPLKNCFCHNPFSEGSRPAIWKAQPCISLLSIVGIKYPTQLKGGDAFFLLLVSELGASSTPITWRRWAAGPERGGSREQREGPGKNKVLSPPQDTPTHI